jgi:hypothetical protein
MRFENPENIRRDIDASTQESLSHLVATAYRPLVDQRASLSRKAADRQVDRLMPAADDLPANVKADVDSLLDTGVDDVSKGKWSDDGKKAWKKVFADFNGMSPDEMFSALNSIGSGINEILASHGVKNHVGIAPLVDKDTGKTSFYMLINGPRINSVQNGIDAFNDHETEHCILAGSMGGPPEKKL